MTVRLGWALGLSLAAFALLVPGISSAQAANLKLKWAFAFPGDLTSFAQAVVNGDRLYTGAYILSATPAYGHARKHWNHLTLIHAMLKDGVASRIASAPSLRAPQGAAPPRFVKRAARPQTVSRSPR